MTREEVKEKVAELTRELSDEDFQNLVSELLCRRGGWTVTDGQWEELNEASRSVASGKGVRVDDIDAFLAECERSSR